MESVAKAGTFALWVICSLISFFLKSISKESFKVNQLKSALIV